MNIMDNNVAPILPYVTPQLGRDYWVCDNFFINAKEIAARCRAKPQWRYGFPHTKEPWPGMRAAEALLPEEAARLEDWVRKVTGQSPIWVTPAGPGRISNHNFVQLVGQHESGARPHIDARNSCKYAAVLYLSEAPDANTGTSFYRLEYPDGTLGGNICPAPHNILPDILKGWPPAWHEDIRIDNKFNRVVLYRADIVHSATGYSGDKHEEKRLSAVFFWMA